MANKLDELIPTKLLENPIPLHSHWDSFQRCILLMVPATTVGVVSFVIAALIAEHNWSFSIVALFVLLGIAMLFIDVYAVFVFEDERADKEWRRNTHMQQLTIIQIAITNLTIVNKATNVFTGNNQVSSSPASQAIDSRMLYPTVDENANATYQVAAIILKEAIKGWAHNNARPKIKPISYDAITKLIPTGAERWKESLNLLEDAKLLRNPTMNNWELLVKDETQALKLLDSLMIARGYYRHMNNNQPEWRRALPQLNS